MTRDLRLSVHIVFLTSGNASHRGCCDIDESELSSARERTARRAAEVLGVAETNLHFLRLRDGELPHPGNATFEGASQRLAALISRIKPRRVFTTNPFEAWPDHIAAEHLTRSAMRHAGVNAELYHYCVWFWVKMPLRAIRRVDWANAVALADDAAGLRKMQAIQSYLGDVASCGHAYCGRLAPDFIRSVKHSRELFFHVPRDRWQ